MNLPALLFSQPSDLQPLLFPFGQIAELKILDSSDVFSGYMTVAVEYSTTDSAYEAKMTLDGQVYVNHVIKVEFIQPLSTSGRDESPLAQQSGLNLSCQKQGPAPLPLSTSPFAFNSQRMTGYDEGYLPKAGDTMLPRALATSAYCPSSMVHSPYVNVRRPVVTSHPGSPAPWYVNAHLVIGSS
jgi:hypothetical protein